MTRRGTRGRRALAAVAAVAGLAVAACGGGAERSVEAFCGAYDELAADDPFAELAVASPGEMRTAFERLRAGAAAIADAAPSEVDDAADRYRDAVEAMLDELRATGFDPRGLDTLAYRTAHDDYEAAAVSVSDAAGDACIG